MTPLSGHQWVVVLQISLPVILLDEALKYLSRNHMDGEWEAPGPLPCSSPACLPACLCCGAAVATSAWVPQMVPAPAYLFVQWTCSWVTKLRTGRGSGGCDMRCLGVLRCRGLAGLPTGTLLRGTLPCSPHSPPPHSLPGHCAFPLTLASDPSALACLYPGILRTVSQAWSGQPLTTSRTPDHTGMASLVSPCGWVQGEGLPSPRNGR